MQTKLVIKEPDQRTSTIHVHSSREPRVAFARPGSSPANIAKTAGCYAISIIIELVHGQIDGGRDGTTHKIGARPLMRTDHSYGRDNICSCAATRGGLAAEVVKSPNEPLVYPSGHLAPGRALRTGTLIARVSTTRHFTGDYCHSSWPRGRCALDRHRSRRIKLLLQHSSLCAANVFTDDKSDDFARAPGKEYNTVYIMCTLIY